MDSKVGLQVSLPSSVYATDSLSNASFGYVLSSQFKSFVNRMKDRNLRYPDLCKDDRQELYHLPLKSVIFSVLVEQIKRMNPLQIDGLYSQERMHREVEDSLSVVYVLRFDDSVLSLFLGLYPDLSSETIHSLPNLNLTHHTDFALLSTETKNRSIGLGTKRLQAVTSRKSLHSALIEKSE
ncbi:hypothetical protein ACFE04_019603 [Oxalis oulophora]